MGNINNIGTKVRTIRKTKGITLQQLSDTTHLSIGYLSNLERNISSPTLENMSKICKVLGSSIGDMLSHGSTERIIIRKNNREVSINEENSIRCEMVDFGTNAATYMYMTLDSNSKFNGQLCSHEYDEIGTVISGEMSVNIEENTYNLFEGDTIIIKANKFHCVYNTKDIPCVTYWVKQWIPG